MANAERSKAIKLLQEEFPEAVVGLDNYRPYAKLPDGRLFGVLFNMEQTPAPPWAIIQFTSGHISAHNYSIYKVLAE